MKKLIRKDFKKGLGDRLIGTGERVAGALAAQFASKKLANVKPELHGPGLLAVGLLIEAFVEEDHIRNIGQGITIAGTQIALRQYAPQPVKDMLGLSGTDLIDTIDTSSQSMGSIDYEAMAGVEDPDDIQGIDDPAYVDDLSTAQLIEAKNALKGTQEMYAEQLSGASVAEKLYGN